MSFITGNGIFLYATGDGIFLYATGNGKIFFKDWDWGFQDILLMEMGFRDKLRWKNGIRTPPPLSGAS